ncbi:unnamed protein product [Parnassius mnemosyne]|uniref:Pre-C2HC domain-containing protein n=1 Tax=Parnassius mnemosyne TaxID=213953 RepID=A0AAV1L0F2_9NEOP
MSSQFAGNVLDAVHRFQNDTQALKAAISALLAPPALQAPPPVIADYLASRNSFAPLEIDMECSHSDSASSTSASRKRPAKQSSTRTSESSDSDDTGDSNNSNTSYTTVSSKRAAKRAAKNRSPPAEAARAAPPTPAAPAAAASTSAAPAAASTPLDIAAPSKPASRCAPQLAKKQAPPPVFLRDKAEFTRLSKICYDSKIKYEDATNLGVAIKILPTTIDDFRRITKLFTYERVSYHTYALPEERKVRVVIRGVPFELSNEEILADLKSQGFPVEAVHKMHSRTGLRYPVILVILSNVPEAKTIFRQVRTVCGLSGVKVESPRRRGFPAQCHRCQLYGHAAANCSAPPRCVKCLDPHITKECPKDAVSPPACVLCQQTGHPASYRGCPCAPRPRIARQAPPPVNDRSFPALYVRKPRQGVSQPSQGFARPPQGLPRPPQAPLRPPPGFSKPMQAPVFAWGPKKVDPPPQVFSAPQQKQSTIGDDFNTVYAAIRNIDINEISVLASKLRAARSPQDRLLALAEHSNLLRSL